jgi:hypothetical protein
MKKSNHGGDMEGAGRPKSEAKPDKLVALGGAKWVRAKIY